jgi:hypothetical protein
LGTCLSGDHTRGMGKPRNSSVPGQSTGQALLGARRAD